MPFIIQLPLREHCVTKRMIPYNKSLAYRYPRILGMNSSNLRTPPHPPSFSLHPLTPHLLTLLDILPQIPHATPEIRIWEPRREILPIVFVECRKDLSCVVGAEGKGVEVGEAGD